MARIQTRSNVPVNPLRWSIERASGEFKLAANTLRKILNQAGAEPDEGNCYTTTQICECIYGDLRAERLRKERQLTKKYELENAIVEASVVDRAELEKGLSLVASSMVSRIMASELSRAAKEDLLKELSTVPILLKDVVRKQTRLPRGNGAGRHDGDDEQGEAGTPQHRPRVSTRR